MIHEQGTEFAFLRGKTFKHIDIVTTPAFKNRIELTRCIVIEMLCSQRLFGFVGNPAEIQCKYHKSLFVELFFEPLRPKGTGAKPEWS